MPRTRTPYFAYFAINHGVNGWSEIWPLPDSNITDARATTALLAEARSFLLAQDYILEWASVRRGGVDYIEWAAITDPLAALPQWGPVHADHVGLLWRFQAEDGKWANRLFRGVDDAETADERWTRAPFTIPTGAVARPADPTLATIPELYDYVLALFRDRTCHLQERPVDVGGLDHWEQRPWLFTAYRMVSTRNVGSAYRRVSWEPLDYDKQPGFTPCGTAVSVLRACYETDCRFFSSGPVQGIRYYWAEPGAATFPYQHIFWALARDKKVDKDNLSDPGEYIGPGARTWQNGSSWSGAPGLAPDGVQIQFLGQTVCPWGSDPETPLLYQVGCDVPLGIRVDDDPGAVIVLNVTRTSFVEDDFVVMEIAPGWAKVGLKKSPDLRDPHAWRFVGDPGQPRWYIAGATVCPSGFTVTLDTYKAIAVPFYPGKGGTVEEIGFTCAFTGGAGRKVKLAIYEEYTPEAPEPGALIWESGDIDVPLAITFQLPCPFKMRPDRLYWLCMKDNALSPRPLFDGIFATDCPPVGGYATPSLDEFCAFLVGDILWTDPWPAIGSGAFRPSAGSEFGSLYAPAIFLKFSDFDWESQLSTFADALALTLAISSTMTTYTPGVIQLIVEMSAVVSTFTPPTASMSPDIPLTLEIAAAISTFTPPAALSSPEVPLSLEISAAVTVIPLPLHYWKFDAGAGNTEPDIGSGAAITATFGFSTWLAFGGPPVLGGNPWSLDFTTGTDAIVFAGSVMPAANWTVSIVQAWDGAATNVLLFGGLLTSTALCIWLDTASPGIVNVGLVDGTIMVSSAVPLATPQTTRITVVDDGGTVKLYFNAALVGASAPGQVFATATQWYAGAIGGFSPPVGIYDDVRVYDFPLNAAQIARIVAAIA